MTRHHSLLVAVAFATCAAACGPDINLTKALELTVTESGYFDAGIVDGKTHLLPSLTFALHNTTDASISSVQLLFSYYQDGADGEFDSTQATGVGPEGVAAGQSTAPVVVRSPHGYTLEGARADFFTNSLYKDVIVKIFAKKRAGYMPLGEFKIGRRILEPVGRTPGSQ